MNLTMLILQLVSGDRWCRALLPWAVLLLAGLFWLALPAVAVASHQTGVERCDRYEDKKDRCECMYHVTDLVEQQLVEVSPNPGLDYYDDDDPAYTGYKDRDEIKDDDDRAVAWWRVESWQEACARLDMMSAARGITRFLASSVTGLVGISFVWSVVQLMQESISGGRVVEARNNLFRSLIGLAFFGSSWIIYESVTIGLFGVQHFTAGSFVGLTGHFGHY